MITLERRAENFRSGAFEAALLGPTSPKVPAGYANPAEHGSLSRSPSLHHNLRGEEKMSLLIESN